ncbi:MAG: hypothetical protein V2J12_10500 [Gammaproteobacteria bacterium]|jgi:hypothetical protein|nr:hypothetical protein [Gammaproteobacteria bacterium]
MEQVDRDLLDWIAAATDDPALAAQIAAAEVKKRDFLRTGFLVYFARNDAAPPVPAGVRPVCPHLASPELMDGAGCDLFLRDGRLHYLEVYARGGFMPEKLESYRLVAEPLL